jgi:beta-aspartyl-peptidase (threonine type)
VRILEDDPAFDAGRGSRLNCEGRVEMDASIMDGSTLEAGAVAAIRNVLHPIGVARRVMIDSRHVMLVGDGARAFARASGARLCRTEELLVGRELERYRRVRAGERELVEREFDDRALGDDSWGTVGAVALDSRNHLAAATSTGGTQDKAPGRVGDTPVIGAGTYADDLAGAASATGWGESILRVVLSKYAVDRMAAGRSPLEAGAEALVTLERVRGKGGLILVDPRGRVATVFNTPRMARGRATTAEGLHVHVEPEEGPP